MNYPSSLPQDVLRRCWKAGNGELGVKPEDVDSFLDACDADGVPVLGWEIWLVDCVWDGAKGIERSDGIWTGIIPDQDGQLGVWSSEANSEVSRRQIAECDWRSDVRDDLHAFVRFNFTLDD